MKKVTAGDRVLLPSQTQCSEEVNVLDSREQQSWNRVGIQNIVEASRVQVFPPPKQ